MKKIPFLGTIATLLVFACGGGNGSGPDTSKMLAGTIALEGSNDASSASIKLFKPVAIDTLFSNLNNNYPSVGVTMNQLTEFNWRTAEVFRSTTSNSTGEWQFDNIADETYHVVYDAPGYGWLMMLNTRIDGLNLNLFPETVLQGSYDSELLLESGKYYRLPANVIIEPGVTLTIEPGVIIELEGNSRLEVQGNLNAVGLLSEKIYFFSDEADASNSARLRLQNTSAVVLRHAVFHNVGNNVQSISSNGSLIEDCRFHNGIFGADFLSCTDVLFRSNVISGTLNGVTTNLTSALIERNAILNIELRGIESLEENGSTLQNNVIKNCGEYGLSIDQANLNLNAFFNDFISNSTHIFVDVGGRSVVNNNNFLNESGLLVLVEAHSTTDTLNYENNYWGYGNALEIQERITDQADRQGTSTPGPLIDFTPHEIQYINW